MIDGLRDLEDFARLHFRVEGLPGNLLTNAGRQIRIYLTNLTGTPSLRLFRAAEATGGTEYLTSTTIGNAQVGQAALGVLTNGTALALAGTQWNSVASNRFLLPTIFEGISTGRCVIVFAIASNAGPDVAISRPFYLELHRVSQLFEHWTVGDDTTTEWNQIPMQATNTLDSVVFGPPQTPEEMDYILYANDWRRLPWSRRAFAHTAYKRLWHLGYRGRFGLFTWPTDYTTLTFWNFVAPTEEGTLNRQNYDRSEQRAWKSAAALNRLLLRLNELYPTRVRVYAHSLGNVAMSEALRRRNPNQPPFVFAYVATQSASVAHAYDAINPEVVRNDFTPLMTTPEMYAAFPLSPNITGVYFTGMNSAVTTDSQSLQRRTFNFHNEVDFALNSSFAWPANQLLKPDIGWYSLLPTTTKQYVFWRGNNYRLYLSVTNLDHVYEIYSHIAEARSKALGCSEDDAHQVRGEIRNAVDLHDPPFSFGSEGYEHSAQFNSINMNRRLYWWQVLTAFSLTDGLPQP